MAETNGDVSRAIRSLASLEKMEEFFGQRPKLEYPRLPYKSNLVTVEAELEHGSVWLQFMPHEGWAELRVVSNPFGVMKLELLDISHINVRRSDNQAVLVIRFARALTSDLRLYLQPVALFWGNTGPGAKTSRK